MQYPASPGRYPEKYSFPLSPPVSGPESPRSPCLRPLSTPCRNTFPPQPENRCRLGILSPCQASERIRQKQSRQKSRPSTHIYLRNSKPEAGPILPPAGVLHIPAPFEPPFCVSAIPPVLPAPPCTFPLFDRNNEPCPPVSFFPSPASPLHGPRISQKTIPGPAPCFRFDFLPLLS